MINSVPFFELLIAVFAQHDLPCPILLRMVNTRPNLDFDLGDLDDLTS